MAEEKTDSKKKIRNITFRVLKAMIKAVIVYALYFFLMQFLAPVSELVPGFQQLVETFVIVYIVLMVLGTLTSGTIFQYFFNTAQSLYVMLYLLLSLNGGTLSVGFENVSLMVDLRLFLMIVILLSLLGLAKSVLQAVNFLNERAEYGRI